MTIYQCPVKHFEGEIEIESALGYPQLASYERCVISAGRLLKTNEEAGFAELRLLMIPGILACVKSWRLANVPDRPTLETFPSTPKKDAAELYDWLVSVLRSVINGEDSRPN